jgi:hypothetical protein
MFQFACDFDGYEVFGGFDPLAELANGWKDRWLADGSLPTSLRDLRGCLFFERRRFHHFGEPPTGEDARYIRALLRRIRMAAEAEAFSRAKDLDRLYSALGRLEMLAGRPLTLADPALKYSCPDQGVYFFFEAGEVRASGRRRVVRVGTHAVSVGSTRSLWDRLSQHRGTIGGAHLGGGNHRGSVFRKHVGLALLAAEPDQHAGARPSWGNGSSAPQSVRAREYPLELQVSAVIRAMPMVWVSVPGAAGPENDRALIERGAIALLSNRRKPPIDASSPRWLGGFSPYPEVRESGLWNVKHVDDRYDTAFIDLLESYVDAMGGG